MQFGYIQQPIMHKFEWVHDKEIIKLTKALNNEKKD